MDIKADLEKYKQAVALNKGLLEKYQSVLGVADVDVHFIPDLKSDGSVLIETVSFMKDGKSAQGVALTDVAAMFFYEAYRELLPQIFARAIERADNAVVARAQQLKAELESKRSALAAELEAADGALAEFLPAAAPSKKAAGGKR